MNTEELEEEVMSEAVPQGADTGENVPDPHAFLVVDHLKKAYGPNVAVEDLSFSLVPGKIYGLLGPNGAGKSTTMNIMTGYIAASGGTVTVGGFDIFKDARKAKSQIGYLPELPPLYPDMTVFEYLKFAAELKGVPRRERLEAVDDVMEETDIMDVSDRMIRNLSKGYKQRVGFAQALLGNPRVIILDEPTVGLDPRQIMEFRDLIRKLGQDHIVLLSSHILQEISAVCDHVFIIAGGKLLVDDDVENLSAHMGGGRKLIISAKGDEDAARSAVLAVEGVENVLTSPTEEGNLTINVSIAGEDMETIRENISLALMEQRIPIFEMKEEADSLESIFLEVTEAEPEVAEEMNGEGEQAEDAAEEVLAEASDAGEDLLNDDLTTDSNSEEGGENDDSNI